MTYRYWIPLGLLLTLSNCMAPHREPSPNLLLNSFSSFTQCLKDKDCTITQADCCGCNQGGKQIAINQEMESTYLKQLKCEHVMCLQVISTDPSCKAQKTFCNEGQCELDF